MLKKRSRQREAIRATRHCEYERVQRNLRLDLHAKGLADMLNTRVSLGNDGSDGQSLQGVVIISTKWIGEHRNDEGDNGE